MNWLLLRGLGREKSHWGKFSKMLKQEIEGEVLCLDIPGAGDFHKLLSPMKVKDYVDFLKGKWQPKSEDDWSICAISLGGMIALEWLYVYPNDFQNAVVVNTSASDVGKWYERLRFSIFKDFIKILFQKDVLERERTILKITTNLRRNVEDILKLNTMIYQSRPVSRKNIVRQLYAASRFRSPDSTIPNVLFLSSKEDKLVNPKCSVLLAEKYGKKHFQHETAGHDLPIDDPEWIINKFKQEGLLKIEKN